MAKGKEPENLELIGGLALMLPEMAAKIAEGGSVALSYDGENLDFAEAKPVKGKDKPGKGDDDGEESSPKKGKKGKPEKEEKPKGKPKKGLKIESLEEFDEKATVDNIDDVQKWAEDNTLDFEASTKPKITLKRIREAAIEEWGEDDEDWAEGE